MKYVKTDSLNRIITENPRKLVNDSEGNYYCQLNNVCGEISKKRNTHPVILISGPSGSGKTSAANEMSRITVTAMLFHLTIIFVQILRRICQEIKMAI